MEPTADKKDPNPIIGSSTEKTEERPVWNCELTKPSGESLPSVTVGEVFQLYCKGDFVERLQPPVTIYSWLPAEKEEAAPSKDSYALKSLEPITVSETDLKLEVTTYRVGQHTDVEFVIADSGGEKLKTSPLSWTVESVIKDPKQQPYGPMGPFEMRKPWWYYAAFVTATLIVLIVLFRFLKKRMDRKKMIDELTRHGTALTPFNQLNKELRKISRRVGFYSERDFDQEQGLTAVEEIERAHRMYLVRELFVMAEHSSVRQILRETKKYHPKIFFEREVDLRRLFAELDRAKKAKERITKRDCEQLIEMVRLVAHGVSQIKRRRSR
ncbi:MAG: hypothetical protein KDD61_17635 [Bdellovibrionales bacterium]|nr:hypothetical protein [Bdellovibrionales bacterium]